MLIMGLSTGTISTVVEEGTITGYNPAKSSLWAFAGGLVMVPIFRGALKIIKLVEDFSPIDSLSSGRSITWGQLGSAVGQVVVLLRADSSACSASSFLREEKGDGHRAGKHMSSGQWPVAAQSAHSSQWESSFSNRRTSAREIRIGQAPPL